MNLGEPDMKKLVIALLTVLMILSLAACTGQKPTEGPGGNNSATQTTAGGGHEIQPNPVELKFFTATQGVYATIQVDSSVKMDDESAWLGLCPAGKTYITEEEADEVDVIWFHSDYRTSEEDRYVFACDFESVEDGTYALVVCTSDDAEVGYVKIQLTMTKADGKLTFDYTDAKLNERPAK